MLTMVFYAATTPISYNPVLTSLLNCLNELACKLMLTKPKL
jgi:hypothetical protein